MLPPFGAGKAIPDLDGNDEERSRLERKAARGILAGLRKQLDAALPEGTTEETALGAPERAAEASQDLRDALYASLVDGSLLGVDVGRRQTESLLGVGKAVELQEGPEPTAAVGMTDWTLVNADAREWARFYTYDLVKGINDTTAKVLRQSVSEWVNNRLTYQQLLEQIADAFSPERADRIATTEITRAYAEGNRMAWKAGGVIETMEWRTAVDERVCPSCGPRHGTKASVDVGFEPNPPLHPRCRCWVVPVVKR